MASGYSNSNGLYSPKPFNCYKDNVYLQNTLDIISKKFKKIDEIDKKLHNYKNTFISYINDLIYEYKQHFNYQNMHAGCFGVYSTHHECFWGASYNFEGWKTSILYDADPYDRALQNFFQAILDYDHERFINGYELEEIFEDSKEELFIVHDRNHSINLLFNIK